ncbi:uncharacterized protein VTP21DRAFT_5061 [Calcarisporiella thermophila]|uniref:uncharacterized protein n=1 Tax=Calcarisporiella thermophila TaxID=911321 RepID=UPI0037436D0B
MRFFVIFILVALLAYSSAQRLPMHHRPQKQQGPKNDTLEAIILMEPELFLIAKAFSFAAAQLNPIRARLRDPNSQITIFAPSNVAVTGALDIGFDTSVISNMLYYHIVDGILTTDHFVSDYPIKTNLGAQGAVNLPNNEHQVLIANKAGTAVSVSYGVGNATITKGNIRASNGVLHIIDRVLRIPGAPSEVARKIGLTKLATAFNTTQPNPDNMQGITIFAPNDEALSNSNNASDVLKRHIFNQVVYSNNFTNQTLTNSQGVKLTFSNSTGVPTLSDGSSTVRIVRKNVLTTNGVIHVIDGVLSANTTSKSSSPAGFEDVLRAGF